MEYLYIDSALEKNFYCQVAKNLDKITDSKYEIIICGLTHSFQKTQKRKIVFSLGSDTNENPNFSNDNDVFLIFRCFPDQKIHPNVIPIPLPASDLFTGNGNKPILSRDIDVFFCGQVLREHHFDRVEMLYHINLFQKNNKKYGCFISQTESFGSGLSPQKYSDLLSNSKICLVPNGNNPETFRFAESAKCGCLTLTKPKMNYWYYHNSPHLSISSWKDIHFIIPEFLEQKEKLEIISYKQMEYYKNNLSIEAITLFCANEINKKKLYE